MKRTTLFSASCALALLAAGTLEARANLTGYNQDPAGALWDRGDAGTGFAFFDLFTTWKFNQEAAASSSGILSPVWSQTQDFVSGQQGGGLYLKQSSVPAPGNDGTNPGTNGDLLFGGGNPVNFVLGGTVEFTISGLVLQVKRAGSQGTLADANGFAPLLSINGGNGITASYTSLATGSGDTASDNGNYSVTSYYWNVSPSAFSQNDGPGATNNYAITASKGVGGGSGLQRSIDGFQVDLANVAVPEPTAGGLCIVGIGLAGLVRRRRSQA